MPDDQPDDQIRRRTPSGSRIVAVVADTVDRVAARAPSASTPSTVLLVTALVGLAAVALSTVASAQIYDNVTDHNGIAGFDRPVLDKMIAWRTPTRKARGSPRSPTWAAPRSCRSSPWGQRC